MPKSIERILQDYYGKPLDKTERIDNKEIDRGEPRGAEIIDEENNEAQKTLRNSEYLAKIDRGFEQLKNGGGTMHELIED